MLVDLISFQDKAVKELRQDIADALDNYQKRKKTQVVSLQAPTGSGKTIIAAALIESIMFGLTLPDGTTYEEQPEAIFVWLSDSPELNEQSKQKILLKTSKIRVGQCITITEEAFDQELLDDGNVYFLNTQKISRSGNLTQHKDSRQFTIWETLENTIEKKSDRLYFIIDEAHRGAKAKTAAGTDTTIMQRFIRGYEYFEDDMKKYMHSMPVVLGISATAKRFQTLISNISNVSLQTYVITADDVRSSGLLKDRIVITYPDDPDKNNDMVLLSAAVDEWVKKCVRWHQYTSEQHYANVDPVLVIQVCQGAKGSISETNLNDILAKVEEKCGYRFKEGEVVHCFGDVNKLEINGLNIPHVKASEIADDHKIKIVFFKEALSTGWDCPRAEAMMSFAVRNDSTYIAQLLGRMVRTPLQMRVSRDEFLNDVKLYLPHFDKDTVKNVIDDLQSNEGGDIPTEINGESLAEPTYVTYTTQVHRTRNVSQIKGQTSLFDNPTAFPSTNTEKSEDDGNKEIEGSSLNGIQNGGKAPEYIPPKTVTVPVGTGTGPNIQNVSSNDDGSKEETNQQAKQLSLATTINRDEIIDFINKKGFKTYLVRQDRINDYLKSLLKLADLLKDQSIYLDARNEIIEDVLGMMRSYIDELHESGKYDELEKQVLEFKLSVQTFDPFGKVVDEKNRNMTLFAETDIDRQLRNADARLGRYGFTTFYQTKYYNEDDPTEQKIDCILFAADEECRAKIGAYAKQKLNAYNTKYRLAIVNKDDACKKEYRNIMADSDAVSEQLFAIPESIVVKEDPDGELFDNHLLISEETGLAKIKLDSSWEKALIDEEAKRTDFSCWLRNPPNSSWGLCVPYEMGGATKKFYPDFFIIRNDASLGYIVDVLEPHGRQYTDNLPKAKALATYAKKEDRIGRIQLIHKSSNVAGTKFVRLDLTDMNVRDKILRANNDDELNNIFTTDGI